MKIHAVEVEGFGVWTGLKLERLDDALNVFCGPNEAGKTTLLQFIRSVLYGFAAERRHYLPPLRGGRPGGSLAVGGVHGSFQIARYDDPAAGPRGELTLTAADGTRQGEHLLSLLLADVDEPIFNNVFAVSLQELQELGTLSGTEAAEMLYRIAAGLDRISLVDVMRELEASRNRLLSAAGDACQVLQLRAEQEKLRAEIEELGDLGRRYGRLAAEHNQLDRELGRLGEERTDLEHQARTVELALSLREPWRQRAELDRQLSALKPAQALPEGSLAQLDALVAAIRRRQERIDQWHARRQQFRAEARELAVNDALWRHAARIEALGEQRSWIENLQQQVTGLEEEISGLETEMQGRRERLGLGDAKVEPVEISRRALVALRPAAAPLGACRRQVRESEQAVATARETARSLGQQIDAALSARGERSLSDALDRLGTEVAQYRRRLQIDERLTQLSASHADLEEQSHELLEQQLLPAWVLVALGSVFMAGVVLVAIGLLLPESMTGSLGWAMALLGLGGAAAAAVAKVLIERSHARRLEACQTQLGLVQAQTRQVQEERDALDRQFDRGGGPIAARLSKATQQLSALEELVPLDARRQAAIQDAEMAQRRTAQARAELHAARKRWRQALAAAHLPKNLSPRAVRQHARYARDGQQTRDRLQKAWDDLRQRQSELEGVTARIAQIVADTGVPCPSEKPFDQFQALADALAHEQARAQRRQAIGQQLRQVRRRQSRHEEAALRLKRRRRDLLRRAGVQDEQEFRQLAIESARVAVLRQERESLQLAITASLAGQCSEEAIARHLEPETGRCLEAVRDEFLARLATLEKQLQQRFEHRGRLAEQMKTLAEDRQLPSKQLEMAVLQQRLDEAVRRWQVLAVTNRILDDIRVTYERQRQPETLQEASGYLERLTNGRYRRVWTPLGQQTLRVDDAEGNVLGVDVLSRGTREQLFLALRLALAASYARRGAALPIVLDDVLVNFDAQRAKAAAGVLRDFAAAGHQILVFTCHEHVAKLFRSLHVTTLTLPDNSEPGCALVAVEPVERKPARRAKPDKSPAKIVVEAAPEEEVDDVELDDEEAEEYEWEEADEEAA